MSLIKYSLAPRTLNRVDTPSPFGTWDPWSDLGWFQNRVNRVFGESATDASALAAWAPPVNVEERDEEILLTAELPGLHEEDIELEVEDNVLTISGAKRDTREEGEEGGRFHLVERTYGSFRRSFTLPRTVDSGNIGADFEGGLLTVRMPKAPEAKSRKIKVAGKA